MGLANIRGSIKQVRDGDLGVCIPSYNLGKDFITYVQAKEEREAWQWWLYGHSLALSVRDLHELLALQIVHF